MSQHKPVSAPTYMGMHKCMPIPLICASEQVLISDVIILNHSSVCRIHFNAPSPFPPLPCCFENLVFYLFGEVGAEDNLGYGSLGTTHHFFWGGGVSCCLSTCPLV